MNSRSYHCLFAWFCAMAALAVGSTAFCDEPADQMKPVKITLHPQAAPVPSLKYRLLPDRLSQQRGNAAVHYGKVTAEETSVFGNEKLLEQIADWQETPLEELRGGKVNLPTQTAIEASLRRGALCTECDCQLPVGESPYYMMSLPEAQQARAFGRILAVRARIQIADRQYEDAITTLQTGYALGRNVAKGETLVNGLVGIAICELMNRQVREYVQQPGSPNLYWALTDLPTPMIEMHRALEIERMGIQLTFPVTAQARTAKKTADEWKADFMQVFRDKVFELPDTGTEAESFSPEAIERRCDDRLPAAKKYLIESGLPETEVAEMPKFQIAMLYSLALIHENMDDATRYYRLPFPEAIAAMTAAAKRVENDDREIVPISQRMMPALKVSYVAPPRLERKIDMLRVFEALRLYAAGHNGKLPEALANVTEAPIPNDPATGKAFDYKLTGDRATLRGPLLDDQSPFRAPLLELQLLDYEITMTGEK
jgi:hypothetical protein